MMSLLNSVVIWQSITICLAINIELEGVVKLGNNFSKISEIDSNLNQTLGIPKPTVPKKAKHPKKFVKSSIVRANLTGINKTNELKEYVDRLKIRGANVIQAIGKKLLKEVKTEQNFSSYVNRSTNDFVTIMQKYYEFIADQRKEFIINEQFVFLDMVETACRLVNREQKKIFITAIAAMNVTKNESALQDYYFMNANYDIYKLNIKIKREEMRHICHKYEICRPYPAFTDYFADFIVDILKLPEKKFETLVKLLRIIVQTNEDFFNIISNKEDKEVIVNEMTSLLGNVPKLQATLLIVRAVLSQRFKIIHSPNLKLKTRTQAVRILLNIIDKAYQYEQDEVVTMEFDSTVKAIRGWVNNQRPFPEYVITQFFINIFKTLDYNLSKHAKMEVNVLIESMLRGSSKDGKLFKELFSHGSKYVQGEDFHSDLEIVL